MQRAFCRIVLTNVLILVICQWLFEAKSTRLKAGCLEGCRFGPTAIVLAGCLRLGAACAPLRRGVRARSVPVGVSFVRL